MRVKDLPVGDRPRERLLERGPEALDDLFQGVRVWRVVIG